MTTQSLGAALATVVQGLLSEERIRSLASWARWSRGGLEGSVTEGIV